MGIGIKQGRKDVAAFISGTVNAIPKFLTANSIGNSQMTDDGTTVALTTSGAQLLVGAATSIFGTTNNPLIILGPNGGSIFTRETALTTGIRTPITAMHRTTGNAAAGHGATIAWAFSDDTVAYQDQGDISCLRGASDTEAYMSFRIIDTTLQERFRITKAESILYGTDGLDFTPGSDVDVDLLTINVTGTPRQYWYEAQDLWMFESTNNARIGLDATNGNDSIISFFEATVEKARIMYDGGLETLRMQLPGGTDALRLYPDGEVQLYNLGETGPTVAADTFSMWAADVGGGGTCAPFFKTEDGNIIKLYQNAALTAQLTTITYTAPGTPDYAIQDLTQTNPYGFVTKDEGNTVLSVIENLQARVKELENILSSVGFIP